MLARLSINASKKFVADIRTWLFSGCSLALDWRRDLGPETRRVWQSQCSGVLSMSANNRDQQCNCVISWHESLPSQLILHVQIKVLGLFQEICGQTEVSSSEYVQEFMIRVHSE